MRASPTKLEVGNSLQVRRAHCGDHTDRHVTFPGVHEHLVDSLSVHVFLGAVACYLVVKWGYPLKLGTLQGAVMFTDEGACGHVGVIRSMPSVSLGTTGKLHMHTTAVQAHMEHGFHCVVPARHAVTICVECVHVGSVTYGA